MNKELLNRFLTRVNQYAKSVAGQSFSLYLTQNGERKMLVNNSLVKDKESIRKSITPIISGQNFEKIEIIFKEGRKQTPFAQVLTQEIQQPVQQSNPFDFNSIGLGLAGISPDIQQQGLGAVIAAVTQKQVDERFQAQDLVRKNELINNQKDEIEKLNAKIQELINKLEEKETEIAEVRTMKQSFNFKGLDITEFLGITAGKMVKHYPKVLTALGVPEDKIADIFSEEVEELKQIENANTVDEDNDGAATPLNNDEKIKLAAIKNFTDYLIKLPNAEFKEVMEINLDLQPLPLEKKIIIHDIIKSEIPQSNG